ncbi:zinc finger protein Xfin [Toxorhynchites rutilus septentrionalis]|uniref:zinc finger protein Xfin n=1 Tax=Toxorhynchites rutilus septentrionalis TaxID=329112 RepID=UPI00247A5255|nr:zinc finger protein Xfin [Toxorhynchites rutilus septentrionalis]
MCTKSLSCPLCCKTNFPNIDALRISLLKVTSRPLKCPICTDELLGLDKLTIHLFGHSIFGQEKEKPVPAEKKKVSTNQLKNVRKPKKESPSGDGALTAARKQPTQTVQTVQVNNSNKCNICGDEFRDQSLLRMHTTVFHGFPSTPSGSPQIPTGEGINVNKEENRFQCNMCSKTFKMKGSLKIHIRVVHLGYSKKNSSNCSGDSSGTTPTVTTITASPIYQNNGMMQNIVPNNVRTPPPQQPQPQQPQPQQPQPLTIAAPINHPQIIEIIDPRQLAEFIYVTNQHQQIVERTMVNPMHPNIPSPKSVGSIPSPSQPSPLPHPNSVESNKQWECDVCLKSFTTKYFLKKHKRLHTGEMPYSCQICGKSFTFQQSYHKHLLYHSDEKPHICSICGRAFKELSTLHNHERIHSGEKPFSCETCGKCFRQRVSYLVHRRIHTNTQPYKCTACDKSFRYKVSQRTHKCLAQPPGTVVRQTGDLLQKLLQSSAILPTLGEPSGQDPERPSSAKNLEQHQSELNDCIKSEEYINRALDEILNESYDKMGICENTISYEDNTDHRQQMSQNFYGTMSNTTSQHHTNQLQSGSNGESGIVPRIENLCLMSPGPRDVIAFDGESMEVIDSIKLDLLGE